MLTYARWRYFVLLSLLLLAALFALPNVFPQDPSVQVTASRGAAVDEALRKRVEAELRQAGVTFRSVELEKNGNMLVRLGNADQQGRAADTLRPELGSKYVVALNLASTMPDWLQKLCAPPSRCTLPAPG